MQQEQVYREFLDYDWDSLEDFQSGLQEIFDSYLNGLKERDSAVETIPAAEKQQLIDQAKSFFYCSHTGNILSLEDFYQWKRENVDVKVKEIKDEDESQSSDPPYSSNYQELVELIVSGKPVPGIKQIPDTVLGDQKSQSTATQRRKPWESSQ